MADDQRSKNLSGRTPLRAFQVKTLPNALREGQVPSWRVITSVSALPGTFPKIP